MGSEGGKRRKKGRKRGGKHRERESFSPMAWFRSLVRRENKEKRYPGYFFLLFLVG
jgi:hypothetical protein